MKRRTFRLLSGMLAVMMLFSLLVACKRENGDGDDASVRTVDIIKDGQTAYAIVYNNKDEIAADAANRVWDMLYENYEVSISLRSDRDTYDYEIVVCGANREEIAGLDAELTDENDFIIRNIGNRLFLYAKSAQGSKRMLLALRDELMKDSSSGTFAVPETLDLRGHSATWGNTLTLCENGATEYRIIHSESDAEGEKVAYYVQGEIQRLCGVEIPISTDRRKSDEKEILIGTKLSKRDEFAEARGMVKDSNDFIVTVLNQKAVIAAPSSTSLLKAAQCFIDRFVENATSGALRIGEADEYRHLFNGGVYSIDMEKYSALCIQVLGKYPTLYDEAMAKSVTSQIRRDQELCTALIERMGESAVLCIGKSSVLWNGLIQKLNTQDYSVAASSSGDAITVPADFANRYFGAGSAAGDAVDIKALAETRGYTVTLEADGLVIITPPSVASFADDGASVGGYTNRTYKNRMLAFFNNTQINSQMPEPGNNTEQSRVVIEDATDYYPTDSVDYTAPIYTNYYSPSVLRVERDGKSVLYASNERCRTQNGAEISTETVIWRSDDGGQSWQELTKVPGLHWASLFELNGAIYLIGDAHDKTGAVICKLAADEKNVTKHPLWSDVGAITNPVIIDGVLYLALDYTLASCPVNLDITNPENWTRTGDPSALITRDWYLEQTGNALNPGIGGTADILEGNVVKGKDGEIYGIWRIETQPKGNMAVMLRLSADGTELEMLPGKQSLVRFPTTVSRFVIHYDAETQLYIAISNWWTVGEMCRARNVLGISVSSDLTNWKQIDTLLVDREMMNSTLSGYAHAFQYADWDFDGDDLVMTVRETTGFANTFHDGKYFTFYRVENFRDLITQ